MSICLPIALENNRFDIRYLRPVTVNMKDRDTKVDATDGGSKIYLADLVNHLVDWRGLAFGSDVRQDYINYYGIKAIKANLETATTNINGNEDLLSHFPGLRFSDEHTILGSDPAYGMPTRHKGVNLWSDWSQFRIAQGYIEYQNNGLNVTKFTVTLNISIIYDWGETKPDAIVVTIDKTLGQDIVSVRRK